MDWIGSLDDRDEDDEHFARESIQIALKAKEREGESVREIASMRESLLSHSGWKSINKSHEWHLKRREIPIFMRETIN